MRSDFEDALESKDWSSLYNINDPNKAIEVFLNLVKEALDIVAPKKAIKIWPDKPKISLKKDTLATMALRDQGRKAGNRKQFKKFRNSAIKLLKRDKIKGVLSRLKKNPSSQNTWQEAKTVLGRGQSATLPECTTNSNPSDTAEHQNKFFINKIADLVASIPRSEEVMTGSPPSDKNETTAEKTPNLEKTFSFRFVTPGSVTRIIKRLKNTKAMGVDEIPTEVWKKGVTVLAGPIARICNLSLSTGIFPNIFRQAIIQPVFKGHGKDPRHPGSYRPISILPSLSKILETAVRDALLEWLKSQGYIPESQFGFLPDRSVTMALACAQTDWIKAKSNGESVGVLCFDLSSAFDTVATPTLLAKLKSTGITGTALKWFNSYMCGRSQKVLWNDLLSTPLPITHGVPQGSILGPTLFLVMVADMPRFVLDKVPNAKMTSCADDSTAYVHANNFDLMKTDLETVSSCMISYCSKAGLVLNSDKTQLLVSSKKPCQIKMGTNLISSANEINLLGVDFDSNFSTLPYLHKLARAANTRAALISRLSFNMPPHLLSTFANGLLMGKILAACPITIPLRISDNDRYSINVTEDINRAIKSAARTITKTKLSDKV